MAKIPFDPRRQAQGAPEGPRAGQGFGMAPLAAAQGAADVIGQIGRTTAALSEEYMAKHKRADMLADETAYAAFARQAELEAAEQAAGTADKTEIERIYTEAQERVSKYVDGKNDQGHPNVRWKDQVPLLRADAEQTMRVRFEELKVRRKLEVAAADTRAKRERAYGAAIEAGDKGGIDSAVEIGVLAGELTAEQAQTLREAGYQKSEQYRAGLLVAEIGELPPEDAAQAAELLAAAVGDPTKYGWLDDGQRKQLQADAKRMVQHAKAQAARAEQERIGAAGKALDRFMVEHGRVPVPSEFAALFPNAPDKIVLAVLRANAPVKNREAQAELFEQLRGEIAEYGQLAQADETKRMSIEMRLSRLDPDLKAGLSSYWKVASEPGKEAVKLVSDQIATLLKKDHRFGKGGQLKKQDLAQAQALQLSRFHRWIETEKPKDAQIIDYVQTDPLLRKLVEQGDDRGFLEGLRREVGVGLAPGQAPGSDALPDWAGGGADDAAYGITNQWNQ